MKTNWNGVWVSDPGAIGVIDLPCNGNASFTSLGTGDDREIECNDGVEKSSLFRSFYVDLTVGRQHPKDHPGCPFLFKYPYVFFHDLDLGF